MQLAGLDIAVVVGYLALLAFVAWRLGPGVRSSSSSGEPTLKPAVAVSEETGQAQTDNEARQYFLANGRMPWWAAACSFVVTAMTAASILGLPQAGYQANLVDLMTNLSALIALAVIMWAIVPKVLAAGHVTVYGLLDHRFGPQLRPWAAWWFVIGRCLASGARLYIAALAFSLVFMGEASLSVMTAAMSCLVLIAIAIALRGGMKAVIGTDVMQTGLFIIMPLMIAWSLWQQFDPAVTVSDMVQALDQRPSGSAFTLMNDWWGSRLENYSFIALLLAWPWLYVGAYGTDQDLAQRMLSTGSSRAAFCSLLGGVIFGVLISLPLIGIGMMLWLGYHQPDMLIAESSLWQSHAQVQATGEIVQLTGDKIFIHYLVHQAPEGLVGLLLAGVAAAAVTSLTSEVNALASVLHQDCLQGCRKGSRHNQSSGTYIIQRRTSWLGPRCLVLMSAGGLILAALLCAYWHTHGHEDLRLIPFALKMMIFAYAGLVAVFLATALPGQRHHVAGIAALLTGLALTIGGELWWSDQLGFIWRFTLAVASRDFGRTYSSVYSKSSSQNENTADSGTSIMTTVQFASVINFCRW